MRNYNNHKNILCEPILRLITFCPNIEKMNVTYLNCKMIRRTRMRVKIKSDESKSKQFRKVPIIEKYRGYLGAHVYIYLSKLSETA